MNLDFGNILRGFGIFACIGAILLVALIAFAVRSFGKRRNTTSQPSTGRRQSQNRETRGQEQPRYDDDQIKSSGGFGVPATGRSRDQNDERSGMSRPSDRDDRISRDRRSIDRNEPLTGSSGEGDLDDRLRRQRRDRDDDDDDVRSRGGFGGG